MESVSISETVLCWDVGGRMELVPLGVLPRAWEPQRTGGACYVGRFDGDLEDRKLKLAVDLITILVRDGVDPKVLHEAMQPVDEYRDMLPLDALTGHWHEVELERRK